MRAYTGDKCIYGLLAAAGYLLKEESPEVVAAAVRAVAGGEEWYSQGVLTKVIAWARGYTNTRMAKELFIGEQTVKNHVSRSYAKLGVCSRAEAVAWAWEHGVMEEQ